MIGAGSLVTKSVPNNELWIGSPAKHIGYICNCGNKLDNSMSCGDCKTTFEIINNKLVEKNKND